MDCFTVYYPERDSAECPECAWIPTKKEKVLLIKQGRLVELAENIYRVTPNEKKNFFAELLYYSRQKNFKDGWASYVFKTKYGHFPHNKKIEPMYTRKEVRNFIRYYFIK